MSNSFAFPAGGSTDIDIQQLQASQQQQQQQQRDDEDGCPRFTHVFMKEYAVLVSKELKEAIDSVTVNPLQAVSPAPAPAHQQQQHQQQQQRFTVRPVYERECVEPGFCRYDNAPLSQRFGSEGRIVVPNHVFHPVLLTQKSRRAVFEFVYPEYQQQMLQFVQAHKLAGGTGFRNMELRLDSSELTDHILRHLSASVRAKDGYHILPTHIEITAVDSNIPVFVDVRLMSSMPTHALRSFRHAQDYRKAGGDVAKMHDWCTFPRCRNGAAGHTGILLPPYARQGGHVVYTPSDDLNSKEVLMHLNSRLDTVLQQYKSAAAADRNNKKRSGLMMRLDMPSDATPKASYTHLQRFVMYNRPELMDATIEYLESQNIDAATMPALNVLQQGASGEAFMYVLDRVLGQLIEEKMERASPERYCMNLRELVLACKFDWEKLEKIASALAQHTPSFQNIPYFRVQISMDYQEFDDKEADEAMKFQQLHR